VAWPRTFLVLIGAFLLSACAVTEPPIADEAEAGRGRTQAALATGRYHTVVRGDTLYGIAFRYGRDYRVLARRNGIRPPYRIYPGQRVAVGAGPRSTQAGAPDKKPAPRPAAHPRAAVPAPVPERPVARAPSNIRWQWPAEGELRAVHSGSGKRGVEIAGEIGQAIRAAAPGQVVYSGDGLVGYGRLIIIKHDDTFFSAYAHNRRLLVREGIRVSGGQAIAEMGSTGTNQVKLYFEIRRDGKPVPPQDYLPRRPL
jgi:lipoprotein NlpD